MFGFSPSPKEKPHSYIASVKEKTNGVETANPDLAKKIQLNDKQVLSRAGSTVDRSPSTRLAAIQGIQKHMREKSNQNSRQSSETEADSKEDESQTIIEEIPTTPISEDEHQLLREPSTSTPINVKSRKDKPRIAILDSAAASTEVPDPSAFESPRTAPAPPMVNSDISFNVEPSRSGSKLHKASRNRTKSSNDTDDEDKDGKSGFMQFRRQVSKLRRPRAGSESGTQPKLSGLKHAVSHDAMSPLSSYTGVESMREAKSSRLVNINDNVSSSATTNGKLSLPNNGQPRRSISMREIRSPSMESEDLIGSKQPKANGEEVLMQNKKSPSHNVLHRQTTSVSSTVSGSSDERFSSVKRSESGRSTSEDSAGSPQISPRNPLRHSRDDSGKSRAAISRSGSARGLERMSNEHKVASQSKLKDGDISPRSTLGSSKLTPAAFSAMKHAEDVKDAPIRSDIVKKLERQTSGSKGIRMISQLLGKSGKKNSTKRVNSNSTESSNADVNCSQEQPPDLSKERSSARSSQVVRRMIIYVQPEDSEEQSANSNTISGLNSIQERASLSSDSSHINSPDSDTGHEYVTAKVITRQPSLKKTVVDGDQPQVTTGSGLTRKGTNGRKWRLENVKEETEAAASTKSAISADTDTLPRSSYSSSIPRSSYDNDSIYKFYNSRTSTSERSLDSVQRASMRSAAHAQLEGLEVREMSDGSVVYGIVKKDRNGRRTSVLLPTNNEQYPVETEILTSDEDEDEIEDRVLQLMGYNPDSPRLSDFTDVDRRSRKTSKEMVPSKSNDRSLQRLPPPQYPPPPIPTRSPRRMASIKQQQQLKPKVSRVQDHRAKHISTIASKSPDGNGATTDIYVAEEATLSGLLDMIKDTGDDMDDYYGEYYSDQTYFPDSDTEVSTDRMTRSATVEEKLDDALKTWEQTSSRRAQPHFQ
ncbi:hypothetical protein BGW37DRAFT_257419 [Umbelopsis sp. PMI_123]|nr:hypothetical protein BGW37DRAFT_257419 [Umbelopsis sp. PMI_123]